MPKSQTAPAPPVSPETLTALLAAVSEYYALAPWEFAADSDPVGLIDPVTGEIRIGHVLGNADEVYAAVFYRRGGVSWILGMLSDNPNPEDINTIEGMDCLKVEFVAKRELAKEDLAKLKTAGFKPAGKGLVWPLFASSEPGWLPWHINQAEAEQLLADLPRLTAFCRLFEQHLDLFDHRAATEIPFLPANLPDRPLTLKDLDWRPLLPPPVPDLEPFKASPAQLAELRSLKRMPDLACEFDCTLLPGGTFLENGRLCFGRFGLLVEKKRGLVIGMEMTSGALSPSEAAGQTLVKSLLMAKARPSKIFIGGSRLLPALQPLCDTLEIELWPVSSLPLLDEALDSLSMQMMMGPPPGFR